MHFPRKVLRGMDALMDYQSFFRDIDSNFFTFMLLSMVLVYLQANPCLNFSCRLGLVFRIFVQPSTPVDILFEIWPILNR